MTLKLMYKIKKRYERMNLQFFPKCQVLQALLRLYEEGRFTEEEVVKIYEDSITDNLEKVLKWA